MSSSVAAGHNRDGQLPLPAVSLLCLRVRLRAVRPQELLGHSNDVWRAPPCRPPHHHSHELGTCNREKAHCSLPYSSRQLECADFLTSLPPWSSSRSQPITLIAVPSVWMTVCTYFTNIPAHIRSFMVHLGKCVHASLCAFQRRRRYIDGVTR